MRTSRGIDALLTVAADDGSACATRAFVLSCIGTLNDKVETMSKSLEETQERTRANQRQIGVVDGKAQAAHEAARQAGASASAADARSTAAGARADAIGRALKRMVCTVVLSDGEGNFEFGHTPLPADSNGRFDELVGKLNTDPRISLEPVVGGFRVNVRHDDDLDLWKTIHGVFY